MRTEILLHEHSLKNSGVHNRASRSSSGRVDRTAEDLAAELLAAFEDAPCFLEVIEREAQSYRAGGGEIDGEPTA